MLVMIFHGDIFMHMRLSINRDTYPKIDGLFHGKSQSKMDDLGLPPF